MGKFIGIDLGTTFSCAAVIENDGARVIINNDGERTTPSAVLFEGDTVIVGTEAKSNSICCPDHYVAFAKRDMGNRHKRFNIGAETFSPEEISAYVLEKVKKDCEKALDDDVIGAVITVPAYFTDAQRTATLDAAKIANLRVLAIINEPTAAALSYGIDKGDDTKRNILVYDLGGGTFDVSVMQIGNNAIDTLASQGDSQLGGYDFDQQIIQWFTEQAFSQGADLSKDVFAQQALLLEAERAKKALSNKGKVRITVAVLGRPISVELNREQFESMIDPYIYQSIDMMGAAMEMAGLEYSDLDKILLVGGSTRIPLVRQMIKEETGIEPSMEINPDEAVAIGAAHHAVSMARNQAEKQESEHKIESDSKDGNNPHINIEDLPDVGNSYEFTDRTTHGIGIEIWDNKADKMINSVVLPANSILPAEFSQDYETTEDFQRSIKLTVRQGERIELEYTTVIGETELVLRPKPKGSPIRVIISCDTDSLIHVHVIDLTDNVNLGEMNIKRASNLNENEINRAKNRLGRLNIGIED